MKATGIVRRIDDLGRVVTENEPIRERLAPITEVLEDTKNIEIQKPIRETDLTKSASRDATHI